MTDARSIQERLAERLGWTVQDVQASYLKTVRAFLDPSPLRDEVDEMIKAKKQWDIC